MAKGPVLFEIDEGEAARPDLAPVVAEVEAPPAAMQVAAQFAARRPSRLARWFWSLLAALVGFFASVAAYETVMGLLASVPLLGWIALGLLGLFALVLLAIAVKELAALGRLRRIDRLQAEVAEAQAAGTLAAARGAVDRLSAFYSGREEARWGLQALKDRREDILDGDALIALAEAELLTPFDAQARAEVEAAARRVATVTAVVPLAFADVIVALTANVSMIRRIAEIYGGRAGTLGSWRLTRAVLSHLVATGAVAVGDDLIGSVAGGGVLSKVSRRFGEGVINGALTARVGVAAMEVCRPMAFGAGKRPSVSGLVKRALTGLFSRG